MQLTEEQKQKVRQWAAAGCGLSELQKNLREECGVALSFMEVRLLVLDLGVKLKEKAHDAGGVELGAGKRQAAAPAADPASADEEPAAAGGVSVELDRVMKPGALASGTVRFSDGVSAAWTLDQFGRLGLHMANKKYRPGPEDLQAFQQELARLLQSRGM